MIKIYITFGVVLAVFSAYWAGGRVGDSRCRAELAIAQVAIQTQTQNKIIEIKREINAETYNTTGAGVRRMLREKYTIRD